MKKLSIYAKELGITYRTAWSRYKEGLLSTYVDETNHIYVLDNLEFSKSETSKEIVIYARVSSNKQKDDLERQAERLQNYAVSNGYIVRKVIKEIGSGLNDNRQKLIKLLQEDDWNILLIENKDRLTRFGFNYIETLLKALNKQIVVVNVLDNNKEDLMQDMISILYSFSARMYGKRRAKLKTNIIISELQKDEEKTD